MALKKTLIFSALLINIGLIFFLWWQGSGNLWLAGNYEICLGRLTGLLAEFAILLQLIFIGRWPFIEQIFGHDKLNRFHRLLGYSTAIFLLSHPLLLTLGYARGNEISLSAQFINFLIDWNDVINASVGLILFIILIILSIAIVRKHWRYETWHFAHLLMYLAILLAWGHQTEVGGDFINSQTWSGYWFILNFGVIGILLTYRFIKPFYNLFRFDFKLEKIIPESNNITSLYVTGKNLNKFSFLAGQFVNLTFLTKGLWFTHPFSFSAAPNGQWLRFTIKTAGDFTNKINQLPIGTKIILDGPLGTFTSATAQTNKFLLIAGGIGITPLRALAEELTQTKKDTILLYSGKTATEIIFKEEFKKLGNQCHFIIPQTDGRLTIEKIAQLAPDFKNRDIYICGPEAMTKAIKNALLTTGVARAQIHYEKFSY